MLAKRTLCDGIWMEEPLTSQLVRVNKSGEDFSPFTLLFFSVQTSSFGLLKIEIIIRNDEGLVWW